MIVLFALNIFGLFQVTLSPGSLAETADESTGLRRSFAEGILAVVLATPCSAPLLGTAVGFALAANSLTILLVFVVLGFGLAAPFVALTLIPGAAKVLPRPGAWMNHLKVFLGFALLGAAVWLVWLVGRLAGVDAMGRLLALLGSLSMSVWIFGLVQFRSWSRSKIVAIIAALSILGAATYITLPLDAGGDHYESGIDSGPVDWLSWDHETIDNQLSQGRAVFVNFTADWCLTCKANERNAIFDDKVISAIEDNDIAMLKADWTHPNEEIRAELEANGKGGVPMYLFYDPTNGDEPEVLSEILTPNMLIDRFQNAASR